MGLGEDVLGETRFKLRHERVVKVDAVAPEGEEHPRQREPLTQDGPKKYVGLAGLRTSGSK